MPRGIPHGYFNKSDKPARALFWVSPAQKLEALFDKLHNLQDPNEVVRIAAEHDVNFLPPDANEAGAHRVQDHAPGRPLFRLMPSARHRSGVPSYWKMSSPKLS